MSWISDESGRGVIGKDIVVEGDVISDGAVRIEGQVKGNIRCDTLVTGVGGQIVGDVEVEELTVLGNVEGTIKADSVLITTSGRVNGDIVSHSLVIEHGAVFVGQSRRAKKEPKIETLKVISG